MILRNRHTFEAISVVAGTIIGAGVLGLPYVFAQTGLLASAIILLVVGSMLALLMLFVGEVSLRTKEKRQLAGYTQQHLGRYAKHLLAAAMIVNIYGAMLAYTIGQGKVLTALWGGDSFFWSLGFYVVFGFVIILGINFIKHIELLLTTVIFVLLCVVMFLAVPNVTTPNLLIGEVTTSNILVTYGVALFACFGLTAVPQVREILFNHPPRTFRRALLIGSILPPVLYVLFASVVVGVTGLETTPVATVGLGEKLGSNVLILGSALAFIAMATSFIALGLALRNVFHRDYGLSLPQAVVLTLVVPAVLFVWGVRDFITILGVVGSFALGMIGIVGTLTFFAARMSTNRNGNTLVPYWFGTIAGGLMIFMFLLSMMLTLFDITH